MIIYIIKFSAKENDENYIFEIYDNGIGLKDNYMNNKEWYSGLNRAKELIFMIGGEMSIDGSKGTKISFKFKNE